MVAITQDQFEDKVRRDFVWLRAGRWLLHPDREQESRWKVLRWILGPPMFVVSLAYAQVLPFLVERTAGPILRLLPAVEDPKLLARIEDLFRVLYLLLDEFGGWSLARSRVSYWLEELDEYIDALELVRSHGCELDETIGSIHEHHERERRESA